MPELPEVEVTRMGLAPFVEGKVLRKAVIRVQRLRSPVGELAQKLDAKTVLQLSRRGKYLVWHFVDAQGVKGWLVTHLGMSGYWRVWQLPAPEPGVHEHVDFVFDDCLVRLTDVRYSTLKFYTEQGLLPFEQAGLAARIRREGEILEEEYVPEGLRLRASIPPELLSLIAPYRTDSQAEEGVGAGAETETEE